MGGARERPVTDQRIVVRVASPADRATAMTLITAGTARGQVSLALMRTGQGLLWVAVEARDPGQDQEPDRERGTGEDAPDQQEPLVGLLLATVQVAVEGDALVGYIQELLVHPAYRRLGVAGHLLDAAEPYFLAEHGVDRIELATSPDNDAAIRLYRSRGYTIHQVRISRSSAKRHGTMSPINMVATEEQSNI
jgi:ribosomal protein S18 acetylase RimI-like enzyme